MHFELRWYEYKHYAWQWDSRHDSWYMYQTNVEKPRLQYRELGGDWKNVPFVTEELIENKPKD